MRRLLLIRHAPTAATRAAAFPRDEPLDEAALAAAAALAPALPRSQLVLTGPALRCRQTAAAAGLDATAEGAIDGCDFGSWAGRTLGDIHAADPEAVAAWLGDPDASPHGGETLAGLSARVGRWLEGQAAGGGTTVAITHGEVVRAAVVHALGAPVEAFWRIDVAPLGITELHGHDGRWTLVRTNQPCPAAAG